MTIPTEPIGSTPRPPALLEALTKRDGGDPALDSLYEEAIRDTIECLEGQGTALAEKILGVSNGEPR